MTVFHRKINKKTLLSVPESERNNFIAVAHLQNEIRFCLYGVVWSHDFTSDNDAVVHGQLALNFFYLKTLSGKLNEGWELLQKHHFKNKVLSEEFSENADKEVLTLLKELKKYFGRKNLINEIRNNLSFHYSPDELGAKLSDLPEELDLYISRENDANTLYYFAEALANQGLITKFGLDEDQNPIDEIYSELIGVAKNFNRFNMLYMRYFFNKYNPEIWECPAVPINIENVPEFAEVSIPFFTDTSKGLV